MSTILTPHAEVIVWNYKKRVSATDLEKTSQNALEEILLISGAITKISTSKSKSEPGGGFEIGLAPTHNWIAKITPGSWCAILMSPTDKIDISTNKLGFANKKTLKMVGRIDSVRGVMSVNEEGQRVVNYIMTGTDWSSAFTTNVYLDPLLLTSGLTSMTAIGAAQATVYAQWLNNQLGKEQVLPYTTFNIRKLIALWGSAGDSLAANIQQNLPATQSILLKTSNQYDLPKEVVAYLQLPSTSMASCIKVVAGVLDPKKEDVYNDVKDAYSIIEPQSVMGVHSLWQLLNDNCNNTLNELIADLRWEDDKPSFTLYKRVRPFLNRPLPFKQPPPEAAKNSSFFKNVKTHPIELDYILSCNAGTNWRDSLNFVEIMPIIPEEQMKGLTNEAKKDSQAVDLSGFARDGFRPLFVNSHFAIYPDTDSDKKTISWLAQTQWKHLLREWYFNTQGLLNGSLTMLGQNFYIGVGDNIMVDSKVLGMAPISAAQKGSTYLLAHIENIAHDFTVNADGSRDFYTSIQFVRGVIVNQNRQMIDPNSGIAIDLDAGSLPSANEMQPNVVSSRVTP